MPYEADLQTFIYYQNMCPNVYLDVSFGAVIDLRHPSTNATVHDDHQIENSVRKRRLLMHWKHCLNQQFGQTEIERLCIFLSFMRNKFIYACETWPVINENDVKINVFKKKSTTSNLYGLIRKRRKSHFSRCYDADLNFISSLLSDCLDVSCFRFHILFILLLQRSYFFFIFLLTPHHTGIIALHILVALMI